MKKMSDRVKPRAFERLRAKLIWGKERNIVCLYAAVCEHLTEANGGGLESSQTLKAPGRKTWFESPVIVAGLLSQPMRNCGAMNGCSATISRARALAPCSAQFDFCTDGTIAAFWHQARSILRR